MTRPTAPRPAWDGWTPVEHIRIWVGSLFIGSALWKRMCDRGFCPRGIHDGLEYYKSRGIEL